MFKNYKASFCGVHFRLTGLGSSENLKLNIRDGLVGSFTLIVKFFERATHFLTLHKKFPKKRQPSKLTIDFLENRIGNLILKYFNFNKFKLLFFEYLKKAAWKINCVYRQNNDLWIKQLLIYSSGHSKVLDVLVRKDCSWISFVNEGNNFSNFKIQKLKPTNYYKDKKFKHLVDSVCLYKLNRLKA